MRIGIFLCGIAYGRYANRENTVFEKDISHCLPNIQQVLVQPLIEKGFQVDIFFSTYDCDERSRDKIMQLASPREVLYCDFAGSNPATCKIRSFELMKKYSDIDVVVMCRPDIHFLRDPMTGVDYSKFNFLFPAGGNSKWWDLLRFTDGNFYVWPNWMTPQVEESMIGSLRFRPEMSDTHALLPQLVLRIDPSQVHFISNAPEGSDVNSFYTICRNHLPKSHFMHPEVKEKYGYDQ